MNYFTLILLIVFCASCGSGDGSDTAFDPSVANCSFDITDFDNGPDANQSNGRWRCTGGSSTYEMRFYADGTGSSTAIGAFTWEQVGCDEISLVTSHGDVTITEMSGSRDSGIASFHQVFDESGKELDNTCTFISNTD